MENNPFQYNMWSAQLVLETYGQNVKVYPWDNVIDAFDISESIERFRLFTEPGNEIKGAEDEIISVYERRKVQVAWLQKQYNYEFEKETLDVMNFLDSTSIELAKFSEEYDSDYLCWPVNARESLMPCFKEYHIYKFYELFQDKITDGRNRFQKMIPDLAPRIVTSRINDTFYWDSIDTGLFEF